MPATPSAVPVRSRVPAWALVGAGVLGVALVVVFAITSGTAPYLDLGNSDPGALVRVGTPVLRFVVDVAATLCTGSLVFAAGFTESRAGGRLSPGGYASVRAAGWWALLWLVATLALVPFDVADQSGEPLGDALPHLFGLMSALEEPRAWLVTTAVVLVIAVGARAALRWATTVALSVLSVFALLPPLVTGHASSDAGHDIADTALLVHVPAAVLWLGVLVAFVTHVARTDTTAVVLNARYHRLATGCWLVLAVSGLVDAMILVPADELLSTGYGRLTLAEIAATAVLGVVGIGLRRRALTGLTGSVAAIGRLVGAEAVLLVGGFALAVGQTHLPPPAFLGRPVTAQETLLGYDLAGAPTVARLAGDWRIDVLFGPLAVLLAAGYLLAVRRVGAWPVGRTVSWLAGCAVMLVATSSGIGRYAPAMFSVHMASHMLLSMLVPLLLVLGAPLTLLNAATDAARLRLLFRTPVVRALTHPVVALVLFAGSPFLLYFTALFDAAVRFHWAHTAIAVYFFVTGVLFAWVVVGVDPTPRRLPNLARLGMLLAAMPSDTVFAAVLMTSHTVVGNGPAGDNFYRSLALPWVHDLLADQRVGGIVALVVTEVTLLAAVVVLLLRWSAVEHAADSAAERAMLERFHQRVGIR